MIGQKQFNRKSARGEHKLAQKIVRRSGGQEVTLLLQSVDRQKQQVTIDVVEYNARFTFSNVTGKIALIDNGRQVINEEQPTTTHVSRSVYSAMARWAGTILNSRR